MDLRSVSKTSFAIFSIEVCFSKPMRITKQGHISSSSPKLAVCRFSDAMLKRATQISMLQHELVLKLRYFSCIKMLSKITHILFKTYFITLSDIVIDTNRNIQADFELLP